MPLTVTTSVANPVYFDTDSNSTLTRENANLHFFSIKKRMLQKKMCVAIYHDFDCFCELSKFLAIICYPNPYHGTDPDLGGRKETDRNTILVKADFFLLFCTIYSRT